MNINFNIPQLQPRYSIHRNSVNPPIPHHDKAISTVQFSSGTNYLRSLRTRGTTLTHKCARSVRRAVPQTRMSDHQTPRERQDPTIRVTISKWERVFFFSYFRIFLNRESSPRLHLAHPSIHPRATGTHPSIRPPNKAHTCYDVGKRPGGQAAGRVGCVGEWKVVL